MPVAAQTFVDADTARRLVQEHQAVLLDVRSPKEFANRHLPGSLNLPLDAFESLDELDAWEANLAAEGAPVILVCASGIRAALAKDLIGAEFDGPVHVLEGGLKAWQVVNGPVVSRERWDRQA